MGVVGGILGVAFITVLAGAIAYIGDRVGHRVGRARLTLFGLRPKYTSTVVAIGTGMLIALCVTLIALGASRYVQTAFFHLNELNDRINQLQAEADALDRHTHDENVVVNRGELMNSSILILRPTQSQSERFKALAAFFDDTVAYVNRAFGPRAYGLRALRPMAEKSGDAAVEQQLRQLLGKLDPVLLASPVLVLAVADGNLFPNDPIHFRLQGLPDKRIFRAHETIAAIDVNAGPNINPQVALSQAAIAAENEAIRHGMPYYFANPIPIATPAQLRTISGEMRGGHRGFVLEARAAYDTYPHLGGLPIEFALAARKGS
jgi:hypothetical protein